MTEAQEGGMQQTSIRAYEDLKPKLGGCQKEVYRIIMGYSPDGVHNRQIAQDLDWEINCVTGRVNELRKKGLVVYGGLVLDKSTGKEVNSWKVCKNGNNGEGRGV